MARWMSRCVLVLGFGVLVAAQGFAQTAPGPAHPRHRHWRECFSILDLTDQQKSDIQAILDVAKPTMDTDVAAVKAARETLKAALESGSTDACALGDDLLAVQSARQTLQSERQAVLSQILAVLTPDQQSRFEGCLDAPRPAAVDAGDDTAD